jgi:hypothetical protein
MTTGLKEEIYNAGYAPETRATKNNVPPKNEIAIQLEEKLKGTSKGRRELNPGRRK